MDAEKVALKIVPAEWDDETAQILFTAVPDVFDLMGIAAQVDCGDARLFHITRDGEIIGAYVLRTDHCYGGDEGVIVAFAGRLPESSLIAAIEPHIMQQFGPVKRYRFHTRKLGIMKLSASLGYQVAEFIAIKENKESENGRRA